ncbi:hypothetical protein BAE30_16850 [Acidithiobacillus caldus]|uniref:Uncharacterized protein n=1 Tax=Acidithiobacillus caldus TaxID=33059 RepID=A0A1E7YRR7_9PROT|nr:hypothetical protein BAE30_16850 [Acidithiobacillus caldus]
MIHHFHLKPTVWHAKPWVFSWDDETGAVSGPDAAIIEEIASWGGISAHPYPFAHLFSEKPLQNKTDMAAIIGLEHELPPALVAFYPKPPDEGFPEKTHVDAKGTLVIGKDLIQY